MTREWKPVELDRDTQQPIEQAIQTAGADVAPRITPEDIEANIVSEHYFTAADGDNAESSTVMSIGDEDGASSKHLKLLTFCVLVLRNGFTVTGESACASPENFSRDIGRKVARQSAINKVWPLMGYALKSQLAAKA